MNIKDETKKRIVENNKQITELLQENEKLIKSEKFNPPMDNYAVEYENRIHIPVGYVRTSHTFWNKYHLDKIIKEYNTRNNISYNLQLSDYYNYLLNRFYIWGSIRTMIYKQDIINLVSILEALVTDATENIFSICSECKNISKCSRRLNKHDQGNLKCSISKLCAMHILDFDSKEINRISELYDFRNRVHIRLAEQNEFLDNVFCRETHNEIIEYLKKITERLNDYAVPQYGKCDEFEEK